MQMDCTYSLGVKVMLGIRVPVATVNKHLDATDTLDS